MHSVDSIKVEHYSQGKSLFSADKGDFFVILSLSVGGGSVFSSLKEESPHFRVDCPQISISPNTEDFLDALKSSSIPYELVKEGYITFDGNAFGCDIPLVFSIHYHTSRIKYIEISCIYEHIQVDACAVYASFSRMSDILRERYGEPVVTTAATIDGHPCEQWLTQNYVVNHFITDRFGLREHLHINFYKENIK